ncbi:MAG: DNA translocase FtsK 4TM domain-containing protein, partial [Phenylobacterium sp.]|uniref:DNA translocase FtsK 4TM domain-containing protein n=1 Tax=Phenylobacterium sp. TaxID=1871053 RepID=UPI001A1C0540
MARVARKTGGELALHIARLTWSHPATARMRGGLVAAFGAALAAAFATYNAADPSLNAAGPTQPTNALGGGGAVLADIGVQSLGVAAGLAALLIVTCGLARVADPEPDASRARLRLRAAIGTLGVLALAGALSWAPTPAAWPLAKGLGGFGGDALLGGFAGLIEYARLAFGTAIAGTVLTVAGIVAYGYGLGLSRLDVRGIADGLTHALTPKPWLKAAKPEPVGAAKVARRKAKAAPAEDAFDDGPVLAPLPVAAAGDG